MTRPGEPSSKVTTAHRAKCAYVYIRQSSPGQVIRHSESTELQYRLVERAIALGWPRERILLIDEDLGKSGASSDQRLGFQHLIAEIGLARVGLVLSLDASRLARNNSDWHHLIELCSLFGALIADSEQLYDPRLYHDRLLLGLSGMMSEAELHHLKLRLQAGEQQKAARGELRLPLPAGLERQRDGRVVLNPDEEIQARLHVVFDKFDELGSARAVTRYLQRHHLSLPTRPLQGAAPHVLVWQPASSSRVLAILHNPAYAGTYVYGQTTTDPTGRRPDHPHSGRVQRPLEHWPVCLHQRYPAYTSWERYVRNQARLADNQNRYQADRHGAPRQGQALLQGLAVCGRCGRRMQLRYSGPAGQYPAYRCGETHPAFPSPPHCQEVRAMALDQAVEQHLLHALAPDQLALALAALEQLEREAETLQHQRQLRIERARYEAERAARQYHAVEPENRLVARSLESQWEAKLRALEALEQDQHRRSTPSMRALGDDERRALLALGQDLPTVWRATTTTPADRKQILRLVIASVVIDAKRERGRVWYRIVWQTGATEEHWLNRKVASLDEHPDVEILQQRIGALSQAYKMDAEIATLLNAEGLRTARGRPFTSSNVWHLRKHWALSSSKETSMGPHPLCWADGTYSIVGAATAIGVTLGTVYQWVREGRLQGCQVAKGMPWKLTLSEGNIVDLQQYVKCVRRSKRSTMEVA